MGILKQSIPKDGQKLCRLIKERGFISSTQHCFEDYVGRAFFLVMCRKKGWRLRAGSTEEVNKESEDGRVDEIVG